MIEIGKRNHRRARHHDLAEFRLPDLNNAGERRLQNRIAEHDLRHFEGFLGTANGGGGKLDLPLGSVAQRFVSQMSGRGLTQRRKGLIALLDSAGALVQKLGRAVVLLLPELQISLIALHRSTRRREILLRGGQLALLHVERSRVDRHLLPVIGIIQARDQCAGIHPLSLIERKFYDPRLNGLKAQHALMGLNVAGDQDGRRRLWSSNPIMKRASLEIGDASHANNRKGDQPSLGVPSPGF